MFKCDRPANQQIHIHTHALREQVETQKIGEQQIESANKQRE